VKQFFESNDVTKGWSGDFKGKIQPTGVYVSFCNFRKSGSQKKQTARGTVTLLR
jgi:hypothetical protein